MCSSVHHSFTNFDTVFVEHIFTIVDEDVREALSLNRIEYEQFSKLFRRCDGSKENGDFLLTFAGLCCQNYVKKADLVGELIVKSSISRNKYVLESCQVRMKGDNFATIVFYLDRKFFIPLLINNQLDDTLRVQDNQALKKKVLIIHAELTSVAKPNARIKYATSLISNALRKWRQNAVSQEIVYGDTRNWESINDLYNEAKTFDKNEPYDGSGLLIAVSQGGDSSPASVQDVYFQKDSEPIAFATQMKQLIAKHHDLERIIVAVEHSGLVRTRKAIALLKFLGHCPSPVDFIPIGSLELVHELEDYNDWLKNFILTMSYHEQEATASDLYNISDVSQAKVYDLHETCLRFALLSSSLSSNLKLERSKHKGALFVQYNLARLASIIDKYSLMENRTDPDYSLLSLDAEWKLLFNHVTRFNSVGEDICETYSAHKLVLFLNSLARDLSLYYRKVRILLDERQPQAMELIAARVSLLTVIRQTLADGLLVLGVNPVDRM
ncbi:Arginine--tRNA ligase [Halotydeus destructor]|nr:Arginine--tRNA ligase [Halotydeus destructor]